MYVKKWPLKIFLLFCFQVRKRGSDTGTKRTPTEGLHHIRGGPAGDPGDPLQETSGGLFPVTCI